MTKRRNPYVPIYPGDWLQGPVAGCSLAAQGLWLRLKFIMHGCEPYGYLYPGRRRVTAETNAASQADVTPMSRSSHADVTPMSRTMSRTCHADVTPSSCSSSKSKERTPLPPAGAGGNLMRWDGREGFREDIFVDMGKARRVITEAEKTALGGSPRQEDVLQLFRNKGFKAETKSTLEAALARPIVCKNDLYEAWLALDVKQFGKAHGS